MFVKLQDFDEEELEDEETEGHRKKKKSRYGGFILDEAGKLGIVLTIDFIL